MTILTRHDDAHIATLTMTAPDRLNALSTDMLQALHDAFDKIAADATIRVVILRGAGRAFCAGHDLNELRSLRAQPDKGAAGLKALFDQCAALMMRIQSLPQPVIAQVHGLAAAAGCQLVATCDLAVAEDSARFGVNGVNIGLFCSTPMVALTRNISAKMAFEMLTTGRFLHASEAQHQGLINRTASAENLDAETRALATSIAQKLPAALRIGKAAFYAQSQMSTAQAYGFTGDVMVENMALEATAEGIDAFLSKRPPNWPA
ncbi:enoyl-CoA hydratase [Loktanella salsilacus]|uniref:enoyl-CoA hydratase n=1 Tax=Loktanella salsilacus TaxID=195913 RepID=UPI0037364C32